MVGLPITAPSRALPRNTGGGGVWRTDPPAWVPALASAILALTLYAITLGGVFIYDDVQVVATDARIRDPHLWYQFWTRDYFNGGIDNLYRPLVSQTYAIQWWLDGGQPWMFHAFNILLHAGAAALTAELGRRLANWRVGLIAGLIFAAHPVHAEAVAGIVGRAELMCAVGMLGAMVLFLQQPMTDRRAVGIYALCMVAALSKEQGLLMPLLLLALEPIRRQKAKSNPAPPAAQKRAMAWLIILLTWSVSLLMVVREDVLHLRFEWDRSFLDYTIQPMMHSHGLDRILVPAALVGRYAALLIAPLHLSIDYGVAVLSATVQRNDPYLWAGLLACIGWIIATIYCARRRLWVPLFCLLATAITYSMASNLIIIGTIFGERLIYLPSIFVLLLAAMLLGNLPGSLLKMAVTAIVLVFCAKSFAYLRHWNNQDAFYQYSLANQPRSIRLHMLVAHRDYEEGRLAIAQEVMADAQQLDPNYWQVWMYSGRIAEKQQDWHAAYTFFDRARRILPLPELDVRCAHAGEMMEAQKKAATQTSPSR